jgi:hypothetical protein
MPKQFSWPHPSDAMNAVAQLSAPGATNAPFACNPRQSAIRSASFGLWENGYRGQNRSRAGRSNAPIPR